MTAKEKYLQVYPDARAFPLTPDTWVVAHGDDPENPGYAILGPEFDSEEAAWQNAAESLPAEPNLEEQGKALLAEYAKAWPTAPVEAKEKPCPRCGSTSKHMTKAGWQCLDRWHYETEEVAEPKPTPSTPAEPLQYSDNYSEAAAFAGITFSQACQFDLYMEYLLGRGGPPGRTLEQTIADRQKETSSSISTEQRLTNAIRWALGEGDDFRPRVVGEGAYWWRNELRARAFGPAAAKGSTEVEGK
jgi:hypothetical protein